MIQQQYAQISTSINKLNNGNFALLPFEFKSSRLFAGETLGSYTGDWLVPRMTWIKERYRKKTLVSVERDPSSIPGWTIYCSEDQGVSVDYDLLNHTTGQRVWCRDGGHVLFASFKKDCTLTLEQEMYSFTEFPLQDITTGYTVYPLTGTPNILLHGDFSSTSTMVLSNTFVGNFGDFLRISSRSICPNLLTKFVVRLTIVGAAGEICGISGVTLLLGDHLPLTPYVDNPLFDVLPSGTIGLVEGACPSGYKELAPGYLFYQTYGDSTNPYCTPPLLDEWASTVQQDMFGSVQHSGHQFTNPFLDDSSGWLTQDAWRGLRVRNCDLGDRGGLLRVPSVSFMRTTVDGKFAGTWYNVLEGFGLGDYTGSLGTNPLEVGSPIDLTLREFSRSVRTTLALPASSGVSFDMTDDFDDIDKRSSNADDWSQRHLHYLSAKPHETLPPWKSFRACMKL